MKKIFLLFLLVGCLTSLLNAEPTAEVKSSKPLGDRVLHFAKGIGSLGLGVLGAINWYGYVREQYDDLVIKARGAAAMGVGAEYKLSVPDILWRVTKTLGLGGAVAYSNYKLFLPLAYRNIKEALS